MSNDTYKHKAEVQRLLGRAVRELLARAETHDDSKLTDPEREGFDKMAPKLKDMDYGSPEYRQCLDEMSPVLKHHYAANPHHPEHFGWLECNGCFKVFPATWEGQCDRCGGGQFTMRTNLKGMNLIDLMEMLCDWLAATKRMAGGGNIYRSIEQNQKRFGYSDEMAQILKNTLKDLE